MCGVGPKPAWEDPRRLLALGSINYAKKIFKPKKCAPLRRGFCLQRYTEPTHPPRLSGPSGSARPPSPCVASRSFPTQFIRLWATTTPSTPSLQVVVLITLKKSRQTRLGRLGIGTWGRRQREYLDSPQVSHRHQQPASRESFEGEFLGSLPTGFAPLPHTIGQKP